jgi:hypothetical protein
VTPLGVTPAAADFIPSCTCSQSSCSCSQLAAGTNVLAVRATDSCGLPGVFSTTTVNADFGAYAGHAVLIGHDYSDAATPDALVGNAVALAPFVSRALPINREARVLAFRAASSDAASVSKVKAAVEARLGAKFDASDPVSYREISDAGQLPSLIRGRDVLLVYDPEESLSTGELDAIGASWAARWSASPTAAASPWR